MALNSTSKRGRRGSASVSEESVSEEVTDYNEDSLQSAASSVSTRKRRRLANSKLQVCHCQEILDKLRNVKGDDGRLLTDSFFRLPKKRSASDYYDVVTTPIDLTKIQSRINNNEYESFLEFEIDFELLVDNAKMYHTSSAVEYQDAVSLWVIYEQEKQNIATKLSLKDETAGHTGNSSWSQSGSESRSRRGRKRIAISVDDGLSDQISLATSDDSRNTSDNSSISDNPLEMLFSSIVLQKTDFGKDVTPTFTFLPSKHAYPQYYEVIKEPIDLRIIAQKLRNGTYTCVEEMERDFQLMIKNAKTFNEPKSEVYQDAVELQKIVKSKRNDYDPNEKCLRKRGRKKRTHANVTEKFAQMVLPKDSDDESEEHVNDLEDSVDIDNDLDISPNEVVRNLQWQLYKAITSVKFNNGLNPTGPFMKLPSKKVYPDYYLEITEPMSLLMVKAKIKNNAYNDVDETLRDINLVFNNAQQFNVEGSGIYKDAVKLQNLANMKRNEMLNASIQYSNDIPMKKSSSFNKSSTSTPTSTAPRKTRPPSSPEEMRVKRINSLFQTIYTYQEDNRFLRDIFMTLPSKEEYPSYYQVIPNPIDLSIIRKKIDDNKYVGHLDLAEDLKLMFSNAKHFNEESSQIYKDTLTLEKMLKKKIKNFGVVAAAMARGLKKKNEAINSVAAVSSPIFIPTVLPHGTQNKIREIFQTIKEYHDNSGRLLSEPFIRLPSKLDMPEYYEYIKKPIELQTINYRINNDKYQTVESFMEDLYLMFDNACKFNEPDSQIYRDALILLRVSLEKKIFLTKDDNISEPPNVQKVIYEIMLRMFKEFYNSVDEDGRYLVDSVREIYGDVITRKPFGQNPNVRVDPISENVRLNLDVIKHDLEKRRYKRMDRLQEDVFFFLRHVRQVSELNSQAYEDSCKLQKIFITIMENSCERGEILLTPALNYTERYFAQEIELENKGKKESQETIYDDHEFLTNIIKEGSYRMLDSVTRQDINFQIGDFVRIQKEPGEIPRVGEICAVLVPNSDDIHTEDSNSDGSLIRVNWYYYPQQTIHKSTRRIMEKEIYQTSVYETVSLNKIVSKCLVMYIKDYMKQTSKLFNDSDIFVCESSYSVKDNGFKKIKKMTYKNRFINENFINRDESITLARNFSNLVSEIVKVDLNDFTFPLENFKDSVLQEDRTVTESCVYYDQFVCDNGFSVKVGDYVYVNDGAGRTQIVRIDQLWKNVIQNVVFFSGPWFINAMDVDHLPTRIFYRKEVFLSSLEVSTHPLTSTIGKCVILSFSDYCKYRPTEYPDEDVFSCQYKYFIDEKIPRKLKKGLKKAQLSTKALDDEIFFFKKEIVPCEVTSSMLVKCSTEPIRQEYITRMLSMSQGPILPYIDEDSKDTTTTFDDSMCSMSVASSSNNGSEKKQKRKKGSTPPSGYVLYAAEIRKKLMKDNPKTEFGLLSKEVGQMWRNIPQADKDVYERRALEIKQAMEKEAAIASELELRQKEVLLKQQQSQQMYVASPPNQNQRTYIQGPSPNQQQLLATNPPTNFQNNNAPIQYFQTPNGQVLQFMPSTNVQTNTNAQFTNSGGEQVQFIQQPNQPQQLIYQIAPQSQTNQQQMLGNQAQFSNAQLMMHQNKMNNFQPSTQHNTPMSNMQNVNFNQMPQNQIFSGFPNHPATIPTNIPLHQNFNVQNPAVPVPQPPQHFVSVPSRSSRVLHSDIYQKYIEKLRKNSSTLSDWKQQLEFSKESVLSSQGSNRQGYINKVCQDVAPGFLDPKLMLDKDGKKMNQEAIVDSLFQLRDHLLQDAMNIRTRILGLGEI